MAYGDFSLKDVKTRFGLTTVEDVDLFASVPEVAPTDRLAGLLRDYHPIALAINTEKARSEYLIAPVLGEVRLRLGSGVSLFSGTEFPADPAKGLSGYCDYIFCRSREQMYVSAPVLLITEAKNDAPKNGLGQCAAGMVGARVFNEREGLPAPVVYGASTTGLLWRFVKLEGGTLFIDLSEYHIGQVAKILGIIHHIMQDPALPAVAA